VPSIIDFTKNLLKGETIVWSGKPAQGLLLTGRDWMRIPFSLLWSAIAIFGAISVLAKESSPIIVKLFGVLFVLFGIYFVAGRFLLDAWLRGGMSYAVTNKRILISRSGPLVSLSS
jgi:hypothetical protein